MNKLKYFAVIALAIAAAACSKDDDNNNNIILMDSPDAVDYQFLDATSYTNWVYFSFEQGKIVPVTDFENDLSWDIAFHRGDLRLNGGASGSGQGAAVNTQTTNWNNVTSVPASGWVEDQIGTITVAYTGTGIESAEQPFSQTLGAWLTIDTSTPPPKYFYHDWIFVVRTAAGKYVKLSVYDYTDAKNTAGAYISFTYRFSTEDGRF